MTAALATALLAGPAAAQPGESLPPPPPPQPTSPGAIDTTGEAPSPAPPQPSKDRGAQPASGDESAEGTSPSPATAERPALAPPDARAAEACVSDHALGQEARLDERLSAAKRHFQACSQPVCPALVRTDCSTWLEEVDGELPRVVFELAEDLTPQQVTIWINGKRAELPLGVPVAYDPGTLALRVEATDHVPFLETLELEAGASPTRLVIRLERVPPPPPRPEPTPEAPPAPPVSARTAFKYALTGMALVGVGVGSYFTLRGVEQHEDAKSSCAPLCPARQVDTIRANLIVADIGFGVGVASAATALFLHLTDPDQPRTTQPGWSIHANPQSVSVRGQF